MASPDDASNLFLEYFSDNAKGEELLHRYGSGISFADVHREAVHSISSAVAPK